ncbi:glycosyltransferase family 2 protein [Larsenimonas rhizosphaerae]|uniref:Glycosyltransferase family 2 protein n=1 Tax=Larsenimonas rhizosphaerae TaxID=2944682 RepID=A0AA41ZMX6_9GAMM|nr:glycosyltransferase family 2 protein [Larsenimonas rhizosphaerae]MCX2524833.1 glycosyltransferase family 2 protein [Larsenimonas rhizosphaerae]
MTSRYYNDYISELRFNDIKVAAIVPAYKVSFHICDLVRELLLWCDDIYIVDDLCPEQSGLLVQKEIKNQKVHVLFHEFNKGVGGAVISGYRRAVADGATILVKVDGDGQMDPSLIPRFITPILRGHADYTKGNRFYDLANIFKMPRIRIFGNAALSFMAKLSTGYWNLFDPTNGYTAIHADVARLLPLSKVSNRYFFETDLLFRLSTFRAVVQDIPMDAKYDDEVSNLHVRSVLFEFACKHFKNFNKRIFYSYFLRDVSIASIELLLGSLLFVFGVIYGGANWIYSASQESATAVGTIVLSSTSLIVGLQLVLAFLGYDIQSTPKNILHERSLNYDGKQKLKNEENKNQELCNFEE